MRVIVSELFTTLSGRNSVSIKNFGSFNPLLTKSRMAVNINTGQPYLKPRYWNIKFHPSFGMKKILDVKREKLSQNV